MITPLAGEQQSQLFSAGTQAGLFSDETHAAVITIAPHHTCLPHQRQWKPLFPDKVFRRDCRELLVMRLEAKKLDSTADVDLPLLIHRKWASVDTKELYADRLSNININDLSQ